jgi:hypothetical protein
MEIEHIVIFKTALGKQHHKKSRLTAAFQIGKRKLFYYQFFGDACSSSNKINARCKRRCVY